MLNLEIIFTILNIIKYLVYILLALAIVVYIFLTVTPVFGGTPDKDTQKTIEDSQNFVEIFFQNLKTASYCAHPPHFFLIFLKSP